MKILIFGSSGLVGSSLVNNLTKIITNSEIFPSTRDDTDLFSNGGDYLSLVIIWKKVIES